ncbi:putative TOS1-like glycosyl hydrolase-domain-containing protein [Truncatella angustata]|uniref:glucan endo-1,3-beta-D-glucosidase n=1 Tax=Truncatella angustata TaxID=152316 RepID=A0A9P8UTL9_9PEZI|nr:putative TOS1-like glycosyl hydrolase-domain-containing protein [Truncatella angustata]KAH6657847.1 putative TOS1-like glycosyl hydrolase-domain-containing protein [Truncatella angustata]
MLASAATVRATDCAEDSGNWYCEAVSLITYTGLDISGSYRQVTNMDSTTGDCTFSNKTYSGSIAPFDEELSVHVRGPAQLKQFAVYTPSSSSTKKRQEHKSHHKRHGHQHLHQKKHEAARAVGDVVTATIDGTVQTWINTWDGSSDSDAKVEVAAYEVSSTAKASSTSAAKSSSTKTKTSSASTSTSTSVSGDYTRIAYYNAEDATADGVTFLGAHGGSGSGVFDNTFGSSLSYLSADGTSGADSSTVLDNVLVGDNVEYVIMSDVECTSGDADCGYYRDGSVAYQGFAGADKVFLFEFTMPATGKTGWNEDMPAIWLLNGKIPRTQQYGDCSCWSADDGTGSGCGEADLFEVLTTGSTKAKSTFHFSNSLGSSDYFDRPTTDYIKLAAVFQSSTSTASIKILDSSFDFATSLTSDNVESCINDEDDGSSLVSSIMDFLTGSSSK